MNTVHLLLLSIGAGFFADLWSFCIGDPNRGTLKSGRIFSFLGRWLMDRYQAHEDETEKHTMALRQSMYQDAVEKHKLWNPGQPVDVSEEDFEDVFSYRPNWWKVTGLCPRCFNVWASSAAWIAICFNMDAGWWFRCLGYFVFIAVSHFALSVAEKLRK